MFTILPAKSCHTVTNKSEGYYKAYYSKGQPCNSGSCAPKRALKVSQYYSRLEFVGQSALVLSQWAHSHQHHKSMHFEGYYKAYYNRLSLECNPRPQWIRFAAQSTVFVFACSCWWSKLLFILENKLMLLSGIVQGEGQDMGHPHLPCSQP